MDQEQFQNIHRNRNLVALFILAVIFIVLGIVALIVGTNQIKQSIPIQETNTQTEVNNPQLLGNQAETSLVTRVIDGDTIELSNQQKVRLIGIDTPETVDPRRPVGCFGKEASNENKKLLLNKNIILEKDVSETDKFGRLLRYVYLPQDQGKTLFVNDYLVRNGYARASTYPPDVKFSEQFLKAEQDARENLRGLWGKCPL